MTLRGLHILVFTLAVLHLPAQVTFRTIVTQAPVLVGESFQVQYVIENLEKDDEFFAPDFKGFRFISGPNIYTGSAVDANGPKKLQNIVYTLVALRPGKQLIPAASARMKNRLAKSEEAYVNVVARHSLVKPDQLTVPDPNEDYFLAPGEDPVKKMEKNLFMKVWVDKKTCFVGEPVTATFKLYSRLESRSDIIKNPGFYGFTVQDVVSLDDRLSSTEKINGKNFDVHIVRKVQLYPLRAGIFHIDEMQVKNKVEFSKSAVSKRTEQEIVEGVFPDNEKEGAINTVSYENTMNTGAVSIAVKPVPEKNKPDEFAGATGNFTIAAMVEKAELSKNEESKLVLTIRGKGNFTQLDAPEVKWPPGIEGFDPSVRDSLVSERSPLEGKREFVFRFVSSKPGEYVLPAIRFSFFRPDSNHYQSVSTAPIKISVSRFESRRDPSLIINPGKAPSKKNAGKLFLLLFAVPILLATVYFLLLPKRKAPSAQVAPVKQEQLQPSVHDVLAPAYTFAGADVRMFYSVLRNCLWAFLGHRFELSGSGMSKANLSMSMDAKMISQEDKEQLLHLLQQCETGVFTGAGDEDDRQELLNATRNLLRQIDEALRKF